MTFSLVNPANTSKTCAECGHVKESTLSDRVSSRLWLDSRS